MYLPALDPPRLLIPLGAAKVSAGFPSPAADYEDKRLDINEYLVRNPVSTFFFPVQGDSMQGAEIFDGDILVVDRSLTGFQLGPPRALFHRVKPDAGQQADDVDNVQQLTRELVFDNKRRDDFKNGHHQDHAKNGVEQVQDRA